MGEKNLEVSRLGASMMKNVWEIRVREYGQKLKCEDDRVEKSALEKINQDWQSRMSSSVKAPRKREKKAQPVEETNLKPFASKPPPTTTSHASRTGGYQSSRLQKAKAGGNDTQRNKLSLLLTLNDYKPTVTAWTKSWKFCQILPELEEGKERSPASDWGKCWKVFNLQPFTEGVSWIEHDSNNNRESEGILFLWEKTDRYLDSEHLLESLCMSEWERSWQYKKSQMKLRSEENATDGPMNSHDGTLAYNSLAKKFYMLQESHLHNEEMSSSDWNESWKATKSENSGLERETANDLQNEEKKNEQSGPAWSESWMYFKKPFHVVGKSKPSAVPSEWGEAWKLSKPVVQQEGKSERTEEFLPGEPLDHNVYGEIVTVSREEKHKNVCDSQFREEEFPLSEWEKSWLTVKTLLEHSEATSTQQVKPKEPTKVQSSEEATLAKAKPEVSKEEPLEKHPHYEVLFSPKRRKPEEMIVFSEPKDKTESIAAEWKESWRSLKHHRRTERVRSRAHRASPLSQPEISLTEWTNSWRFTNVTLNQDSELWQQGWSTNVIPRPDRWLTQNELETSEEVPHNGPTGLRGWNQSWRFTRRQHHVNGEVPSAPMAAVNTHLHRRGRSLSDWESSWRSSTNQDHHDRPSMTDWTDSWSFCHFHCDNWGENLPQHNWFEKSMEFKPRKENKSGKFSRSFEPQTFTERFPLSDWNESWRPSTLLQKHHSVTQHEESANVQDNSVSNVTHVETTSTWGQSWRIANFQPKQENGLWLNANPKTSDHQDMVLYSKNKSVNNDLFLHLSTNSPTVQKWSKSWRFMKMESEHETKQAKSKNKQSDDKVIMTKTPKTRKHIYSQIDKDKPQERRWGDAVKIAKSQPRQHKSSLLKSGKGKTDSAKRMLAEWAESWRFSTDSASEKQKMSISVSEWTDSWKFLLGTYPTQNGPKTKGR